MLRSVLCSVGVCCRYAFVEFDDIEAVDRAMQLTGVVFGDRPIKSLLFCDL